MGTGEGCVRVLQRPGWVHRDRAPNRASVREEQTDKVTDLVLLAEAAFNVARVRGVLQEYLHPPVQGLEVLWVQDTAAEELGVGVVYVPEQPQDQRFTLMKQVIDEGVELRRFVFGFA